MGSHVADNLRRQASEILAGVQSKMSGPIVRTAPTPKFSENWDSVFGNMKAATKSAAKSAAKSAKKKKGTQRKKS